MKMKLSRPRLLLLTVIASTAKAQNGTTAPSPTVSTLIPAVTDAPTEDDVTVGPTFVDSIESGPAVPTGGGGGDTGPPDFLGTPTPTPAMVAPSPTDEPIDVIDTGPPVVPGTPSDSPAMTPPTDAEEPVCYSNSTQVDDLVREGSPFVQKEYVFCPNSYFEIGFPNSDGLCCFDGMMPLQLRSNTHYKCGADGDPANNCTFHGGQFQVVSIKPIFNFEDAVNVVIEGLTFQDGFIAGALLVNNGDVTFKNCIFKVRTSMCARIPRIASIISPHRPFLLPLLVCTCAHVGASERGRSFGTVRAPSHVPTSRGGTNGGDNGTQPHPGPLHERIRQDVAGSCCC
jgi:hypothetical protein